MPFDSTQFRTERLHVQMGYDAAFNYWNFKGVLAERWGHGPIFASMGQQLGLEQVALTPPPDKDERLQGVYGLKESWLLAEGPEWVPQAKDLAVQWLGEVHEVLNPRRTVRLTVHLFGLYPADNPVQVSRHVRSRFYRNENLAALLPHRLRSHQDHFHAAIDWLVLDDDDRVSLIAGVIGPPHQGIFFAWPDKDRDERWWLGFNYVYNRINLSEGIDDPVSVVRKLVDMAHDDLQHAATSILSEAMK